MDRRRSFAAAISLVLAAGLLPGCSGSSDRPARKSIGSAVWVNSSSEPLQPNVVSTLKEAGVQEVFLQAARFDAASGELTPTNDQLSLPGALACTVAVSGGYRGGDPASSGRQNPRHLPRAAVQDRAGRRPGGRYPPRLHHGRVLRGLWPAAAGAAPKLSPKLYLSVTVQRAWLGDAALKTALENVDFFVPFLFGQRIDEKEDAGAWDLSSIERSLHTADVIGRPFALGIIDLGTATWSNAVGHGQGAGHQGLDEGSGAQPEPAAASRLFARRHQPEGLHLRGRSGRPRWPAGP